MVNPRQSIDLRGEICPYTELLAKKALQSIAPGQRLTIDIDHAIAARTIPEMVKGTRLGAVEEIETLAGGAFRITVLRATG